MTLKRNEFWGGFSDGKLDTNIMLDGFYNSDGQAIVGALFKSREEALARYDDVRKVEVIQVARRKK